MEMKKNNLVGHKGVTSWDIWCKIAHQIKGPWHPLCHKSLNINAKLGTLPATTDFHVKPKKKNDKLHSIGVASMQYGSHRAFRNHNTNQ